MPDPTTMEAAVHAYVEAFNAGDPAAIGTLFADDGTVEDPVGAELRTGKEAVLAFYTDAMKTGAKLRLDGPIRICGDYAAFPFSVDLHWEGRDQHVDVIDTFRFDENDKIVEMRAYFGPTNMHGFA